MRTFLYARVSDAAQTLDKLPTGNVTIEVETKYAAKKPAGPLDVSLKVNGREVATGRVPVSAPLLFTANDCLDIGTDLGSPVSVDYYDQAPFKFTGKVEQVKVKYLGSPAEVQEEKRQTDGQILTED